MMTHYLLEWGLGIRKPGVSQGLKLTYTIPSFIEVSITLGKTLDSRKDKCKGVE